MTGRRILYALLLIGCTLMHFAYGQYVTHYILLFMLLLPILSLLISLPAILTSSAELTGGEDVRRTRAAKVRLTVRCRFFLPPERICIRIERRNLFLDAHPEKQKLIMHGTRSEKIVFAPDNLGLISIPIRRSGLTALTVLPNEERPVPDPDLVQMSNLVLKPKPQGFSEEHELRPYREGDAINLIHWKLSEKYYEPIVREPQVLLRKNIVLSADLPGTYAEQQSVLEQLCFLSGQLTEQGIPYVLHFGMQTVTVASEGEFERFLKTVLSEPMRETRAVPTLSGNDTIVYRILPNREVRE